LFSEALRQGVESISNAIELYPPLKISKAEAEIYLRNNISFDFNKEKREALKLFWSLAGL